MDKPKIKRITGLLNSPKKFLYLVINNTSETASSNKSNLNLSFISLL
jgi:hypothetical protein